MASADTQLILDRLQKEGKLLRKDDRTYNIKKVIIANEKTAEAVSALKNAMGATTEIIQKQSRLDELRDERSFKLEKLSVEEQKEYEEREKESIIKQSQLDAKKLKLEEKRINEQSKRDFKIFGKDGILSSALKDTFNFTKSIITFAALGAIAYEFTAGILTELFPEVFRDEEGMSKIPTLFEVMGNIANVFNSETMAQLTTNIQTLADPNFLSTIGILAVGGKVASIAGGALQTLTLARLIAMTGAGPGETLTDGSLTSKIKKVKVGTALVGLSLVAAFGPAIKNYIQTKLQKMTPEEIEQASKESDMLDALGMAAGGAALGSMFGIKGALVGAVAGFIFGLGKMGIEYIQEEVFDKGDVSNDVKQKVNQLKLLAEELKMSKEAVASLEKAGKTPEEIQAYFDDSEYRSPAELSSIYSQMQDDLNNQFVRGQAELALEYNYQSGLTSDGVDMRGRTMSPEEIKEENERLAAAAKATRLRAVANLSMASDFLYADTAAAARAVGEGNIVSNLSKAEQIKILKGGMAERRALVDLLLGEDASIELVPSIIQNLEQGFDPLLKQMETSANAEKLQKIVDDVIEDATTKNNSAPIIQVNNNPDNSVAIQQSKGGDKIANTRIGGGTGGGSYIDMPGLVS